MENNSNLENEKYIQEVYTGKAMKLLKICMGISIFSGLTYMIGILIYQAFDFGLIFEFISFIFIVMAFCSIKQQEIQSGKRKVIIAMIPMGWLIIYDFIDLLANMKEVMIEVIHYYTSLDQYFYYLAPYLFDVTLVASIVLLYRTYTSLNKADGTEKTENYIDNFYDK